MDSKDSSKKNMKKYKKYSFVFDRINESIEANFPIEAIALEECIVADRLRSFLRFANPLCLKDGLLSTSRLIDESKKIVPTTDRCVLIQTQDWIRRRNSVIHGVIISKTGEESSTDNHEFIEEAKKIANRGMGLVRQLDAWVRRTKRTKRDLNKRAKDQ